MVKADGYGHGAVECARAVLAGGATWLAVATVDEAQQLRDVGVEAPILVMGALQDEREIERAIALDADIVVWRERSVALAEQQPTRSPAAPGFTSSSTAAWVAWARATRARPNVCSRRRRPLPGVELIGLMTHFATADVLDDGGFFAQQLSAFARFAEAVKREQPDVVVHAANSAAVLRDRRAHFDMVRCGIAVYGLDPFGEDARARELRPALELQLLRGRRQALRRRAEHRLRAVVHR